MKKSFPKLGILLTELTSIVAMMLTAANSIACTPSLADDFNSHNSSCWEKASWWNGQPFENVWRADHIDFDGGIMRLRIDDQPCSTDPAACENQPYASGEYRSSHFYGYGRLESRLKAAKNEGIVTSIFLYTGASDNNPHDEIDIEILGKDTTKMQINYFANGVGDHEKLIPLGFDASEDFHNYAIDFSSTAIKWYVDCKLVHTEYGSGGGGGLLPTSQMKIMMNLWTGAPEWLGQFSYPGSPIYTEYDWIKYTPKTEPTPYPDIKANCNDGSVDISPSDKLTVELDARSHSGENADWWVVRISDIAPFEVHSLVFIGDTWSWKPGISVTYQGPLFNLPPFNFKASDISGLPLGRTYTYYFGVDTNMNGVVDEPLYYDSVLVNIITQ